MDMTGEYRIPAARQKVWEALNDPEVLKKCIPGCQELDKQSDTEMTAKVKTKVGPVSATFTGKVTLTDMNPPESYKISGEGQGGVAGFAKGGATVNLTEDGGETVLKYAATAAVGGKLAQIGSRLIDSTAKKMADQFFSKFAQEVGDGAAAAAAAEKPPEEKTFAAQKAEVTTETPVTSQEMPSAPPKGGIGTAVWVGGLIAVVVVILLVFNLG
jgi:hypothetical protein